MSDPLRRVTGLPLGEFAQSYWGVAPLLQRAERLSEPGFADLFSLASVDELLSRRGLRTPFLRMSRNGELLAATRFTRSGGAGAEIADQVADDKVLAEFSAGATIVLQGLHRVWPPIVAFASALASQLGHPVQVNAYVTPPQNTGFSAHYDTHDVFVLQFAGSKRWRIHEPVWPLPLRDQTWQRRKAAVERRAGAQPLLEETLEPGDALYLPRGYLHAATSLDEMSGHLTVGVHPVTRRTLADEVLAALGDDIELRRALPLGTDLSGDGALETELTATIAALHAAIDRCDRTAVARGVARALAHATRPAPLAPLAQFGAAATLAPETRVCVRPGLRFSLRADGSDLTIEAYEKTIRIAGTAVDAVRLATGGEPVSASTLPLPVDASLALLAHLLREGIVVPV